MNPHDGRSLFRKEALTPDSLLIRGDILLAHPVSLSIFICAMCAVLVAAAIAASFVHYTRRVTVTGRVVPDNGVVAVASPTDGIIIKQHARLGERVDAGAPLFTISEERWGPHDRGIEESKKVQAGARRSEILEQLAVNRQLKVVERETTISKIDSARNELSQIQGQISSKTKQVEALLEDTQKYEELARSGIVPKQLVGDRKNLYLQAMVDVAELRRQAIIVTNRAKELENELRVSALRSDARKAELQEALSRADQEMSEIELRGNTVVRAPVSGEVSSVSARSGQSVQRSDLLSNLIPNGSTFQVELYVPTSMAGVVRVGGAVRIRYKPFPYQSFGAYTGTVMRITSSAIPLDAAVVDARLPGDSRAPNREAYVVTVGSISQSVKNGHATYQLRSGMSLTADLPQETRTVAEWMLEPLFRAGT